MNMIADRCAMGPAKITCLLREFVGAAATEPRCQGGRTFEDCRGCPPPGCSQQLSPTGATDDGPTDSDPDMDEALRRVKGRDAVVDLDVEFRRVVQQLVPVGQSMPIEATGPFVTCGSCDGDGGKNETTIGSNGAPIITWRLCPTCKGRGTL